MITLNEQVSVTRDKEGTWVRFPYTSCHFWFKVEPNYVSLLLTRALAHELENQLHSTAKEA